MDAVAIGETGMGPGCGRVGCVVTGGAAVGAGATATGAGAAVRDLPNMPMILPLMAARSSPVTASCLSGVVRAITMRQYPRVPRVALVNAPTLINETSSANQLP